MTESKTFSPAPYFGWTGQSVRRLLLLVAVGGAVSLAACSANVAVVPDATPSGSVSTQSIHSGFDAANWDTATWE
jgi:hypothetical protein